MLPHASPPPPQWDRVSLAILALALYNRLASNSEIHLPLPLKCRVELKVCVTITCNKCNF